MHRDVGKRIMAVLLSICMIAGMVDWSGFTARAADEVLDINEIVIKDTGTKVYNGKPQKLAPEDFEVWAADERGNRQQVTDPDGYTLSYSQSENSMIDAKTYTVTITGNTEAGYRGSTTGSFVISKKEISDSSVTVANIPDKKAVAGQIVRPEISISDSETGKTLNLTSDFTLNWIKDTVADTESSATGEVEIVGQGNYKGSRNTTFNIERIDAANLTIQLKNGYSGSNTGILEASGGTFRALYTGNKLELTEHDVDVKYNSASIPWDNLEFIYNPDRNSGYVGVMSTGQSKKRGLCGTGKQQYRRVYSL